MGGIQGVRRRKATHVEMQGLLHNVKAPLGKDAVMSTRITEYIKFESALVSGERKADPRPRSGEEKVNK
jgi:hypothetical protein